MIYSQLLREKEKKKRERNSNMRERERERESLDKLGSTRGGAKKSQGGSGG
jgi:hypothetical protein